MELIKITTNENGEIIVSGRELHEFLESSERYSKWFERMLGYEFTNGVDYTPYQKVHPQNHQEITDHVLKIDMAKEISMIQRNEKGKQARQYFIEVEKRYKQPTNNLELALRAALEHEVAIKEIKEDVSYLKETMRIDGVEQKQLQEAGCRKGLDVLGGKDAPAYKVLKAKIFSDLWGEFKRHFVIPRYSELPKAKISEGLNFINRWRPSTSLELEIEAINSQGRLF